ncbi:MAG: RDD family protein, partial [Thermoplasmata archaeon]|nr:RDD family protein [Thermoplasmata archaeon]
FATAAVATVLSYSGGGGDPGPAKVSWQRVTLLVLLTTGGIVGTFVTTISSPGGINSAFPYFLVTPLAVGVVAALVVPRWPSLGWSREVALPMAYATTTFGTMLGADLLRQPPLYALAHGVIFSIGGAGLLDLVYLSGLLALVAAFGVYRLERAPSDVVDRPPDPGPTPLAGLRRAQGFNRLGRPVEGILYSATAAHDAVMQLRRLASLGSLPPGANPWAGLAVPPWVVADQANLEALAHAPPADPVMAHRAWMTARFLVHLSTVLGRPRFAGFLRRSRAFLFDLLFLSIPGAAGWILYALRTSPTDPSLLTSPGFFLVTSGFATYAFLYFVLSEWLAGTTLGKWLCRLEVTNRRLGRPSILASIIRNTPKMIPLTAVGLGGALAALISEDLDVAGNLVGLVSVGPFVAGAVVAVGVGLPALVSGFTMMLSNESQRLGDYFAGTWVVRRRPAGSAPPAAVVAAAAAPSVAT